MEVTIDSDNIQLTIDNGSDIRLQRSFYINERSFRDNGSEYW